MKNFDCFKENFHKRSLEGKVNYLIGYGYFYVEGEGLGGQIDGKVFIIDVHNIRYYDFYYDLGAPNNIMFLSRGSLPNSSTKSK